MIRLRDYQQEAVDGLVRIMRNDRSAVPLIVAPTGSGKSIICAEIMRRVLVKKPTARIWCIVPRAELARQNADKLFQLGLNPKFCVSSLGPKRATHPLLVATPGSIVKEVSKIPEPDVIIFDEAHRMPPDGEGMYRQILGNLPRQPRCVGLTATPYRMQTGSIVGDFFTEIAYEIPISLLIERGYLAQPTTKPVKQLSLEGIKRSGVDYSGTSAGKILAAQGLETVLDTLAQFPDRKSGIFFCSSIEHSEQTADALCNYGHKAAVITSKTPKSDRKRMIQDFKSQKIKYLVSRDIFTEGFDAPCVDLIVMLRPTLSTGLYVQMVGRGMRPYPGKENCLVLDFVGNIEAHGYIDDIRADPFQRKTRSRKERLYTAIDICMNCHGYYSLNRGKCHKCYPSEAEERTYGEASSSAILSQDDASRRLEVSAIHAGVHQGPRRTCVAVNYVSQNDLGLPTTTLTEFLVWDNSSVQFQRAEKWWAHWYPTKVMPLDARDAVRIIRQEPPEVNYVLYKVRKGKKGKVKQEIIAYG